MEIIILGSGGSNPLPRPLCNCDVCNKARVRGIPYSRTGPSFFIKESAILFDTPEDIRSQLEREKISSLKHVFYTHWHPDHVWGLRIFEHISKTRPDEQNKEPIDVYLPQKVYEDFKTKYPKLFYFESKGFLRVHLIQNNEEIKIDKIRITPRLMEGHEKNVYAYEIVDGFNKSVIWLGCDVSGIKLNNLRLSNPDVLLLECPVPITKNLCAKLDISDGWQTTISKEESEGIIQYLNPKRTIFVHIDGYRHLWKEMDHDAIIEAVKNLEKVDVGYDGMTIEV